MNKLAQCLSIMLFLPTAALAESAEEETKKSADVFHDELDKEAAAKSSEEEPAASEELDEDVQPASLNEEQASAAEEASDAPAPASPPAAATQVEEIQAAPAESSSGDGGDVSAVVPADGKKKSFKADDDAQNAVAQAMGLDVSGADKFPVGLMVVLSHNVSSGNFVAHPEVRQRTGITTQTWDIRPYYDFQAFGKKLVLQGRVFFNVFLNEPNLSPAMRFDYNDSWLTLLAPSLYNDPFTGININAGIRAVLPTGRGTWAVRRQAGGATAFIGARKSFGPVSLTHMVFGSKNFNVSRVSAIPTDIEPRATDHVVSQSNVSDPNLVLGDYAAMSHTISNWAMVTWAVTPKLFLSYGVFIMNAFGYSLVDQVDANTSPNADTSRNRWDVLSPSLDVTFALGAALKDYIDLPFSLLASLGISSTHPAQHADNGGVQWPVIFNTFGRNAGFAFDGSIYAGNLYFTLMGTY